MNSYRDPVEPRKRSLEDDKHELQTEKKRLKTSNEQLRAQNTYLLNLLAPVLRIQSLLGVNSSTEILNPYASTICVYQDPARQDIFLHEDEYSDYSDESSRKRNKFRSSLAKGSAQSLHIDLGDGKRLATLKRRRRHSICYGESKIITDKLPIKSGRDDTNWDEQQKLLRKTKFSATKRIEAIEQQSKSRPNRKITEDLKRRDSGRDPSSAL